MRIALAQIDARVGDLRGNLELIRRAAWKAESLGAELVAFPEQSLGGYPALDLWEDPAFLRANGEALAALAKETGELALLVGALTPNKARRGKPAHNSAVLLHRGKAVAVRHKTLLPTYDVFDESRYFEPAPSNPPIAFKGTRLGVSVCEDAWAQVAGGKRPLYAKDPLKEHARAGADLLLNISSSPFERGKSRFRLGLLAAQARRARLPLLYCNLVGGNDELIFDGNSLVLDASGRARARGAAFAEDLVVVDTGKLPAPLPGPLFPEDADEVLQALTLGIRDYVAKCGFERVFVGLSGGIDSALVCALAARALGPERVTGVLMPSQFSSPGSLTDAKALAVALGVAHMTIPINSIHHAYLDALREPFAGTSEGVAEQNIQARIRGNLLMALSNKFGGLLLSTGNKSELSVGYCTLYGDMSGGLAVLADVPKETVYALARRVNAESPVIPWSSLDKPPSAELKPDQKDQDDLPPYSVLDKILTAYIEERKTPEQIARLGVDLGLARDIVERIDRNEYKRRQAPPSLKISPKAFGAGRRMPIARGSYRLPLAGKAPSSGKAAVPRGRRPS